MELGAMRPNALVTMVRDALLAQTVLLVNAGALVVGTMASSVLGVAYWWIGARYLSPEVVGLTAAAVSAMSLVGFVGQLGLSTLLLGQTSFEKEERAELISGSLAVSFLSSLLLACLFIIILNLGSRQLGHLTRSQMGAASFILGCGVTSFALVLNNVFVGLLKSSMQMYQNVTSSTLKLVILYLVVVKYGSNTLEMFDAWVLAQAASVVVFTIILMRITRCSWRLAHIYALLPHVRAALSHHLLDLIVQTPVLIMPFLVTMALSPLVNAAFNVAWMVLRVTFLVPAALSTVLFAVGMADSAALATRVRTSITISAATAVAIALLFYFLSDTMLAFFSPSYPNIAAHSLSLLGISFFGHAIRSFYISQKRLRGEMISASWLLGCAGIGELALAYLGSQVGGLFGLTVGWTLSVYIQAAFMLPAVLRAADLRVPRIAHPIKGMHFAFTNSQRTAGRTSSAVIEPQPQWKE
jgi:O-antigen/teichoic acid export membrane protein